MVPHCITTGVVAALVAVTPLLAQGPEQTDTLLTRLTREALASNLGLARVTAQARAAAARVRPAGALPDPTLTLGAMDLVLPGFAIKRSDFTEFDVEASQEFPWPGTLGARSRAAAADAEGRQADVAVQQRDIIARTGSIYHRLRYLITARETLRQQIALVERSVEIATTRYASGAVPQTDPLDARVARGRMNAEGAMLAAEEARLRASLQAIRGATRPESLLVRGIDPQSVRSLYATLAAHPHGGVAELEQHPVLAARRAAIKAADETAIAEGLDARPDVAIMARYGARTIASDFFSTSIGLRIPLWARHKQKQLAEAARHEADAGRAALAEDRSALVAEYQATLAEAEAGLARLGILLDDVLPSADAARDAALRSYQVGKIDFQTLLSSTDAVYRARLEAAQVAAQHLIHLAMLQQLTGPEDAQ